MNQKNRNRTQRRRLLLIAATAAMFGCNRQTEVVIDEAEEIVDEAEEMIEDITDQVFGDEPVEAMILEEGEKKDVIILAGEDGTVIGPSGRRHELVGEASWYGGSALQGNPTACGEPFDEMKLTAAHKTLPLGTEVRVTDPATGMVVDVRITDRGPFKNRVIDLSRAAARVLDFEERGRQDVEIAIMDWGEGSC